MGISAKEWTPTLTEKETVLFDLKGYILFPAVLSEDEIAPIVEQCEKLRADKTSLPPEARCLPGGPRVGIDRSSGDYAGVAYGY